MRRSTLLFIGLLGCQTPSEEARLAALESQSLTLGTQVERAERVIVTLGARLSSAEDRIAALDLRPPKVPHLIHSSPRGEQTDLGLWLGNTCVFSIQLGGELCFDHQAFYFEEPACTGAIYTAGPARTSVHHVDPRTGHALRRLARVSTIPVSSYLRPFQGCLDYPTPTLVDDVYSLSDTGVQTIGVLDVEVLHVELR